MLAAGRALDAYHLISWGRTPRAPHPRLCHGPSAEPPGPLGRRVLGHTRPATARLGALGPQVATLGPASYYNFFPVLCKPAGGGRGHRLRRSGGPVAEGECWERLRCQLLYECTSILPQHSPSARCAAFRELRPGAPGHPQLDHWNLNQWGTRQKPAVATKSTDAEAI